MADLEAALGHRFSNPELLHNALVHRSHEIEGDRSNERLEFLGDAVLSLVVAHHLFDDWEMSEGEMAKVRAAVVNEASLARVAAHLGVGDALLLGKGEDASGGRSKASILSDAMEALLGAVYLDAGLGAATQVIMSLWRPLVAERATAPGLRDYKTRLQEVLARQGVVPEYDVVGTGPDHARRFVATVRASDRELGEGLGTSKKRAEQAAARAALAELAGDDA